ncbi:gluconeogenesis factor YvcK family protein [Candidatus Chlorohelix sp.]|uniref:gluconeogenesis factor YvcK family protein n=1 Tax=Candidatus Chlorohelix sp. TaxID=3139201 RepID=UPI003028D72C
MNEKTARGNGKRLKITVIGGGTGVSTVLGELKKVSDVTAIVSTMDSGGSSGRLRDEHGILPPGDILKCISELLPDDPRSTKWRDILNYRFRKGKGLEGHSLGNLLLAAAYDWEGGTNFGIDAVSWLLSLQGQVLPVTLNDVQLIAKLSDGSDIEGETKIDLRKDDLYRRIEYIYTSRRAQVYKPAYEAILKADKVVIGPGSLFTSVLPNFLVEGLPEALAETTAQKIYVCNLVTDPSETDGYKASDFIDKVNEYCQEGELMDYMVVNTGPISEVARRMYETERKFPVELDMSDCEKKVRKGVITGAYCKGKTILRHDSASLAQTILAL